jgi:protoporphyrinogen oxidase
MIATEVLIVGAGLAGLAAARRLHRAGIRFLLVDAEPEVGGRVRTDEFQGFLLDHGFQVFLTAYPEAQAVLDYKALQLRSFLSGAYIRIGREYHVAADPWRNFSAGLQTLTSPIGSLGDKMKINALRRYVRKGNLRDLFARPETTTEHALREFGFSETIINRFFRPFFGGILLERDLSPSSRMFEFIFRMLSEGETALPAAGMAAIPRQLAASLPVEQILLNTRVTKVMRQGIELADGSRVAAPAVIVATEGPVATHLTDGLVPIVPSRTAVCVYYAAKKPPYKKPWLVLNGNSTGIINNCTVLSNVQPSYAPKGQALISVSVVGQSPEEVNMWEPQVSSELRQWFGKQVDKWEHLRTYQIRHAQPAHPLEEGEVRGVRIGGLYVCGDHRANPSINGALLSGRRAAEAVIEDFSRR